MEYPRPTDGGLIEIPSWRPWPDAGSSPDGGDVMQIQKSTVLSEGSLPHYRKVDGPNLTSLSKGK